MFFRRRQQKRHSEKQLDISLHLLKWARFPQMTYIIISENMRPTWKGGFLKLRKDNQRLITKILQEFLILSRMVSLSIMPRKTAINIHDSIGTKLLPASILVMTLWRVKTLCIQPTTAYLVFGR